MPALDACSPLLCLLLACTASTGTSPRGFAENRTLVRSTIRPPTATEGVAPTQHPHTQADPHQMWPPTGRSVRAVRPMFRWTNRIPGPYTIRWCSDRDCARVIEQANTNEASARPSSDLPTGSVFWRVSTDSGARGATSVAFVGLRSLSVSRPHGAIGGAGILDFDHDSCPDWIVDGGRYLPGVSPHSRNASPTRMPIANGFVSLEGQFRGVGDLDGDGGFDWVFQANDDGNFTIGTSSLPYSSLVRLPHRVHPHVRTWSLGDINADGLNDVFLGDEESSVIVFGGLDRLHGFSVVPANSVVTWLSRPHILSVAGADLDDDGYSDILMVDGESPTLYVFNGQTMFDRPPEQLNLPEAGMVVVNAGDTNGDMHDDLAVLGLTTLCWLTSSGTSLPHLAAARSFPRSELAPGWAPAGTYDPDLAALGDLDDDAFDDLLVGDRLIVHGSAAGPNWQSLERLQSIPSLLDLWPRLRVSPECSRSGVSE